MMKKNNNEIYDVIIFGGGVSGLSSAYKLLETNPHLSILVLEARDRVGGRTYSLKKGNATIELGGQWFGPHHKNALDLLKKLDIELIEQYDKGVHLFQTSDGKTEKYEDNTEGHDPFKPLQNLINKLETMAYDLSKEGMSKGKWDKDEKEMDQISLATWLQENSFKNQSDKMGTEILTKVFNSAIGAEPEEYSLLFFLQMLRACVGYKEIMDIRDCAQHWKTVGGSQQISIRLEKIINSHKGCRVLKNAPVTNVTKVKSYYVVETNNRQSFKARYCICAVPLHLQTKITFEPPLPFHRSQLSMRSPVHFIFLFN